MDLYYGDMDTYDLIEEMANSYYSGSPFEDLQKLASSPKGSAFEHLVEEYMYKNGHTVEPPYNSNHDRVIDGEKVEIKGSFLWKDTNTFTWQQIRPYEPDWDSIIFLAAYYDRIEMFYDTRENVLAYATLCGQHSGHNASETLWLKDVMPEDFPTWEHIGTIWGNENCGPGF